MPHRGTGRGLLALLVVAVGGLWVGVEGGTQTRGAVRSEVVAEETVIKFKPWIR